jgi:hypothetical protein
MILEETTIIQTTPDRVFEFFRKMDEERNLTWHPDHLAFQWIEGNNLKEGNVCYFEEKSLGRLTRRKYVIQH